MRRSTRGRFGFFLAALLATAALAAFYPSWRAHILSDSPRVPPGAARPARRMLTVWQYGELPGSAAWVRAQAAAFSRQVPGVSVWLRAVSARDVAEMEAAPPDLLLFTADREAEGEAATALCMSGYALLAPAGAGVTAAPRSLFGLPPTPDPAQTPAPALSWPEGFLADDGFGASALLAMDAPAGGELVSSSEALRRFLAGEAALLTVDQARAAAAQGAGYQVVAAAPATDLVLYGMVCNGSQAAGDFLAFLASEEAQRALADKGLLSALPGLRLYGADRPMLQALEAALDGGWRAPAFVWPGERREKILADQAIYAAMKGE